MDSSNQKPDSPQARKALISERMRFFEETLGGSNVLPNGLSIDVTLDQSREELDVSIRIGPLPVVKVGSVSIHEGYSVRKLMRPVIKALGNPPKEPKKVQHEYRKVGRKNEEITKKTYGSLPLWHPERTSSLGKLYMKSGIQLLYGEGQSHDPWGKTLDPIIIKTPFISRDKVTETINVLHLSHANMGSPVFEYKKYPYFKCAFAWLFWAEQLLISCSDPLLFKMKTVQIVVK